MICPKPRNLARKEGMFWAKMSVAKAWLGTKIHSIPHKIHKLTLLPFDMEKTEYTE